MRGTVVKLAVPAALLLAAAAPLRAETPAPATFVLAPVQVTDWKSVFGRVEARDRLPARARLGGTLVDLQVTEGQAVAAGEVIGRVVDEKLTFQLSAIDAQRTSLDAQLANAETELKRGEDLLARGVTTVQQLDALRTQVNVLKGQIEAIAAERRVIEQQAAEGAVLAPVAGRVLEVPVARGAVVQPGETVVTIGGGGIFLRIAVPERHAEDLTEGDTILIEGAGGATQGRLERVYPLVENGRVVADVAVAGLSDRFVDARVLVRLPLAERTALMVPETALVSRAGLDFVAVLAGDAPMMRAVVPGGVQDVDGVAMVEILSGLVAGDVVLSAGVAAAGGGHD